MPNRFRLALSGLFMLSMTSLGHNAMAQPHLSVTPAEGLTYELPEILLSGVEPGGRAIIKARMTDDQGVTWTSFGTFDADGDGRITVSTVASTNGTYEGVDGGGLFWSMMPVPPQELDAYRRGMPQHPERLSRPHFKDHTPQTISLTAEWNGQQLAQATYVMRPIAANVTVTPLRQRRLRGMYYAPAQSNGKPGIIWLTGSGGGLDDRFSPLLASLGYHVLALAYFNYEDLPKVAHNLPLEYFGEALTWMAKTTKMPASVLVGMSRGTEAALLTAVRYPRQIAAVVAYVPSHVVNNGIDIAGNVDVANWTWKGKPLEYVLPKFPATEEWLRQGAETPFEGTLLYRAAWNSLEIGSTYEIPVEKIRAPILLISGAADDLWPSALGADRIMARLAQHDAKEPHRHLRMPGAGHLFTPPNHVSVMSDWTYLRSIFVATGGTPALNAQASRAAWRGLLSFLDELAVRKSRQ